MKDLAWWQQLSKCIDAKDTKGFVDHVTEDCEFRFGNGPSAVGHAAIAAAVDGFWASIRASRHEITHVWGDADSGVCEGWVTYTRLDGSQVRLPFVDVLHFRDGKAARYLIYMDAAPLFAA